jgi:phage baseplate assembly protein W
MAYVYENLELLSKNNETGLGIGISNATPVFTTLYDIKKQTKENIKTLLLTQIGERYMFPQFGTELLRLLFQPNVYELKDDIRNIVDDALNKWISNIIVEQLEIKTNEDDPTLDHMIEISITYSITNFGLLDNLSISATETGTIVVSDM